jgi:DNA-binding NarL/FixJ family response regulator
VKDPVRIVESAYGLDGTDEDWLGTVIEAMQPSFSSGVGGFFFDRSPPDGRWLWGEKGLGPAAALFAALPSLYESLSTERRAGLLSSPPVMTLRESIRVLGDVALEGWGEDLKVPDALSITAADPSGRGCILGGVASGPLRIDARTRQAWARVAAHVSAGLRLRRALRALPAEPLEAVLTLDGRTEHAEGVARSPTARAALRRAVCDNERARGRLRRSDPEAAVASWKALVLGRWSLIDRFETAGRRYVVAMKNDVVFPDPRRLTERERLVAGYLALGRTNKLIAYSLGIAEGTVAALVARLIRKLGARGRTDCVRLLNDCSSPGASRIEEFKVGDDALGVFTASADAALSGLTARERLVVLAVARGQRNGEIARSLG